MAEDRPVVHLSVLDGHLSHDLPRAQWCLLVQLGLARQEGQGNLVDPSVHDQVDLYLP